VRITSKDKTRSIAMHGTKLGLEIQIDGHAWILSQDRGLWGASRQASRRQLGSVRPAVFAYFQENRRSLASLDPVVRPFHFRSLFASRQGRLHLSLRASLFPKLAEGWRLSTAPPTPQFNEDTSGELGKRGQGLSFF
jgi:hypothetical protein